MRISRRLALLSLVAAGVTFPGIAGAHDRVARRPMPVRQDVTVSLESAGGMALPTVRHHGTTFVAGIPGERYMIRIANNTGDRLEVVVSVDGRDVLTGRLGDFTRQRGYVVEPFGSVVIDGFRRSLDHVAAFRFSDVADSFTGLSGTPQHAGIIGVAVFKERIAHHHHNRPLARAERSADAPAPSTRAPSKKGKADTARHRDMEAPRQEIGTEFAETRLSRVREVTFVRRNAMRPDMRMTLRYDTAESLAARGVPIEPAFAADPVQADAWPAAREFTAPPPRRRFH